MTEAEFERGRHGQAPGPAEPSAVDAVEPGAPAESEPTGRAGGVSQPAPRSSRAARAKPAKPRRVQRMFALEEDLDKKLWLYAIHVGKDRSEVVNDLLRPLVASMVLYDSRDRRSSSRAAEGDGEAAA